MRKIAGAFAMFLVVIAGCSDDDGAQNQNNNQSQPGLCGDGQVDPSEECDEGPDNSDIQPDRCRTDCRAPSCGDGVVDSGEECDYLSDLSTACAEQGFAGGSATCAPGCAMELSHCQGWMAVIAGGSHTCGLRADGTVRCWGRNEYGQLGNGSTLGSYIPVDVDGLRDAVGVAAGLQHGCAVHGDGAVSCWGRNDSGQLGDGTITNSASPVPVAALADIVAVSSSPMGKHTCAITSAGAVFCWGANADGQLGDGTTLDRASPVAVTGLADVAQVAAGAAHTCARTTGGLVWCWGAGECAGCGSAGDCGLLGTGDVEPHARPVRVAGLSGIRRVVAGDNHTCALLDDGSVRCWGCGWSGQLGQGAFANSLVPIPAGLDGVSLLSAADRVTCATNSVGETLCWGANVRADGMIRGSSSEPRRIDFPPADALAVGSWSYSFAAVARVLGLADAVEPAMTASSGCVVLGTGDVRCWGVNTWGQAGPGPAVVTEPQAVALGGPVSGLAAGPNTVCAIDERGRVVCWGVLFGAAHPSPAVVDVPGGAVSVAVGGEHFCAATADGRVWCWGSNGDGQLGDGSATDRLTPVEVLFE